MRRARDHHEEPTREIRRVGQIHGYGKTITFQDARQLSGAASLSCGPLCETLDDLYDGLHRHDDSDDSADYYCEQQAHDAIPPGPNSASIDLAAS
jgi:hypothetical protein